MPLVQNFCESLDLIVEDPQEETVGEGNSVDLIESWRKHNSWAVRSASHRKDVEILYLPEAIATQWWRYSRIKDQLENTVVEDVFVPSILILQSPGNRRLFTMIVWPDGIAQFFPVCDYLLIQRKKDRLFGSKKEEVGLVPYEVALRAISPVLKQYDGPDGRITYLSPGGSSNVHSAVQEFDLMPIQLRQHTRIDPDGFVDVELS